MTEPGRLRDSGDEAQRSLVRGGDAIDVPAGLQARVRAQVAERLGGSTRPRREGAVRWAVAAAVLLVAGGAFALIRARQRDTESQPPAVQAERPDRLVVHPDPAGAVAVPPAEEVTGAAAAPASIDEVPRPRTAARLASGAATPRAEIGATVPTATDAGAAAGALTRNDKADAGVPPPSASAGKTEHIKVDWPGRRRVNLALTREGGGYRLLGLVNQSKVDVTIAVNILHGRLGDHPIHLVMMGEKAGGDARGYPTGFQINPIEGGEMIRGTLPGHTFRVELTAGMLRWYPGCENALKAVSRGVFTGSCVEDRKANVALPPGLLDMPRLPRMIVLAILLTERDAVFDLDEPRLFDPLRE